MRFPPSLLDEIRARLPVSVVVGRRVKLVKSGREYKGLSPFQAEKTPSFYVNDQKGFYHCFSSGKHGDIFRFVTETEGLPFPEAVERLANEAGVSLPKITPEAVEQEKKRRDLYDVMELAAKFFEAQLQKPVGAEARAYLARRQFSERTQAEFRMGFAPESRDALLGHLRGQGVSDRQMLDAGLLIEPEGDRALYDRFRNRVIIPIQDGQGRVVAFGGRVLDPDGKPKYLNSPETALFKKGFLVFNGHRAREAAFKAGTIIAVEGYLDAIAVWQAGLRHVVATLGTAFTEEQIATLWRYAPEPVICFDGDKAGISAANRAIDRILPALKTGFSFRFAFLPSGQDPDDLIKAKGVEAFAEVANKAMGLWDALWQRETNTLDISTPDRQASFDKKMKDMIDLIIDPLVKRRYELQARLRVNQLIWDVVKFSSETRKYKRLQPTSQETASSLFPPDEMTTETIFLGLCVHYPDLAERLRDRIIQIDFEGYFKLENEANCFYNKFLNDLMRVIDDRDLDYYNIKNEGFYNLMNPEFMTCLNYLHGREHRDKFLRWGHNLILRFPIINYHPSEEFIESCFNILLCKLEQRNAKKDLSTRLERVPEDASDEWFENFVTFKRALQEQDELIFQIEQQLTEESLSFVTASSARPGLVSFDPDSQFVEESTHTRTSKYLSSMNEHVESEY
jgi:DNA primase